MKTPKNFVEKARHVGMTFLLLAASRPKAEVDMAEGRFEVCGTVACHAGWFAVANGESRANGWSFCSAADYMARELGFADQYDLETWATDKSLWGNNKGAYMFIDKMAFDVKDRLTLKRIGRHWLKVADRVETKELKNDV